MQELEVNLNRGRYYIKAYNATARVLKQKTYKIVRYFILRWSRQCHNFSVISTKALNFNARQRKPRFVTKDHNKA